MISSDTLLVKPSFLPTSQAFLASSDIDSCSSFAFHLFSSKLFFGLEAELFLDLAKCLTAVMLAGSHLGDELAEIPTEISWESASVFIDSEKSLLGIRDFIF